MKTLSFALLLLSFAQCGKERGLLKKIDGTWQITSIRYSNGGAKPDSMVTAPPVTLTFDACTPKANREMPLDCFVYLNLDGAPYKFVYKIDKSSLSVNDGFGENESTEGFLTAVEIIRGGFDIVQLDDNNLVLFCDNCQFLSQYQSREIRATR